VLAVDAPSMRKVAAWARARKAPLHIHLAEQPAVRVHRSDCCTPNATSEREGILARSNAVHAIHVDEQDIALLGEHRVSIVACTTSERDLGRPRRPTWPPGRCRESDVRWQRLNAVIDMLEEARGLELDQRRASDAACTPTRRTVSGRHHRRHACIGLGAVS